MGMYKPIWDETASNDNVKSFNTVKATPACLCIENNLKEHAQHPALIMIMTLFLGFLFTMLGRLGHTRFATGLRCPGTRKLQVC